MRRGSAQKHFETTEGRSRSLFEAKCLEVRDGKNMFSMVVLAPGAFVQDLVERKVVKDVMVTPTPCVVGDDTRPRHSNLSQLDAKGAFTTGQNKDETSGNEGASFDEWCDILGLCGHIKYEEVEEMTLEQRVAGIIANYLQEKDEHKVISDCLYPPLERYDVASVHAARRRVARRLRDLQGHVAEDGPLARARLPAVGEGGLRRAARLL